MEIIPNVHHLPGVTGGNVYLLVGSTLTLVDTGLPDNAAAILSYIDSLGRSAADLTRIVITHYHHDHVGSVEAIKQRTGARVLAHLGDLPLITAQAVAVDATLEDGDHLDTLAALSAGVLRGATVVHVPGHTPGSIALHLPAERVLLCGDTIRNGGEQLTPPPEQYTADVKGAIASIRRMAELEFDVLCVGHGAPVVGGADQRVRALVQELG
jgi:glyoxylase-like metal-dependent hydrolase (beta-lactamase superfamily II)